MTEPKLPPIHTFIQSLTRADKNTIHMFRQMAEAGSSITAHLRDYLEADPGTGLARTFQLCGSPYTFGVSSADAINNPEYRKFTISVIARHMPATGQKERVIIDVRFSFQLFFTDQLDYKLTLVARPGSLPSRELKAIVAHNYDKIGDTMIHWTEAIMSALPELVAYGVSELPRS
jgi:hypothetical protein